MKIQCILNKLIKTHKISNLQHAGKAELFKRNLHLKTFIFKKKPQQTKVGNHQHTNMILKPAIMRRGGYKFKILEMHWKLRDQQLKIILYNI